MAIKKLKPTSPAALMTVRLRGDHLRSPERSLLKNKRSKAGRNVHGRPHHYPPSRRMRRLKYRVIDSSAIWSLPARSHHRVDPNRTANIALLALRRMAKSEHIAPWAQRGRRVRIGPDADSDERDPASQPGRHDGPKHRDGSPARAARLSGRRQRCPASCERGQLRHFRIPPTRGPHGSIDAKATIGQVASGQRARQLRQRRPQAPNGWRPTVAVPSEPLRPPLGGGVGRAP